MHSIIANIPYFIMAILAFSLLVIIHELGHFMMCKLNGVKVSEFSLGMGPKLFGIKGKETEYLIKAFPVGGYVKMEGEEESSDDPRSFTNKTPVQRLSIVSAGAIMNIVLAVVLFAIVGATIGKIVPVIGDIVPNGAAMKAGMQVGDKITKVNKVGIDKWEQFINEVGVSKGENISIEIVRNSKVKTFSLKPIKNVQEKRFMVGIGGTQEKINFGESVSYGFTQTISTSKLIFKFFGSLFHGKVSVNDVGGPISIIRISTMAAQTGIVNLMMLTAMLSVQLGIFNIIPFPALDGGWIFMLLFEIISGKKLDDSKVGTINYIGFMFLMAFMVFIVIKDIVSPMKF
ncbi:RIP metalloprotease RseP [Clostridium estertheticum]|uniref:Zinc metalloprotease n=1 Tax=Clostridium estertheticum subsp. estertheticum TaxID=1552 RepID=A0A1J0GHT7_9CLOT|nr:RIP metalloprotease RseP [Clostridium estertheticum]APC40921.1 RIP metalloprotease RseP [Clostridium estertheticum subsp. estertheticum]MBU3170010.1 RIP metalloprotease RseP [Clostridium estertheticum]MBU3187108.1 RIP metalloprotease RseP [Clostridium estertheticum]MBZ9617215.1 RIP metalloprotease RseP [Clostridium estertheticum subsp. laramiense]WAG72906.1 RIP metalloprotease RseP [Clostridium estertheticum]